MNKGRIVYDGLKSGLAAFVCGTVIVLIAALLAKWFNLSQNVLSVIGQIARIAAVFAAVLFTVKDGAYIPKALVAAFVFTLLDTVCTLVAGGGFGIGKVALNLLIAVAAAVIAALIKGKRA